MKPKRRRRTPEEARAELLAAAARLIEERGPDNVTLRQIGEAAGVSHGLVTHYFGTYAALVREVLAAENDRLEKRVQERIQAEQGVPTADGIMTVLFDALTDERHLRLFVWAEMHADYQGAVRPDLKDTVDSMETGIRAALADLGSAPSRARIESVVLMGLAAAYGFAIGKRTWLAGLGHDPDDPRHEAGFRREMIDLLGSHMMDRSAWEPLG